MYLLVGKEIMLVWYCLHAKRYAWQNNRNRNNAFVPSQKPFFFNSGILIWIYNITDITLGCFGSFNIPLSIDSPVIDRLFISLEELEGKRLPQL